MCFIIALRENYAQCMLVVFIEGFQQYISGSNLLTRDSIFKKLVLHIEKKKKAL